MAHNPIAEEFQTRVRAAMEAYGDDFERAALINEFHDRGVARSTVYLWLKKIIAGKSIVPPPPIVEKVKLKVGRPPKTVPPPPIAVADIAAKLPPLPKVSDVSKVGLLPVVELLQKCIDAAEQLTAYARLPDGKVRNPRMILQASEHLRRAVETATKLNETVAVYAEMEAFHDAVIAEISEESRDVAERILRRLGKVCDQTLAQGG